MTPRVLGVATIGQAPRADLIAQFQAEMPTGTRIVLRGCLDGLSHADIAARPPRDGADTLYSRLAGAVDAVISKAHVIERAPATLAALRTDGADAILFACTGAFPPIAGDAGVLFPSRLLHGLATGLLPNGRLGLLVPLAAQADKLAAKWSRPSLEVVAEPLIPSAGEATTEAAARRLAQHRPDLVALDCMSYTPATKAILRRHLAMPMLLAVTATGRILREMLE
jgi:protein AroM